MTNVLSVKINVWSLAFRASVLFSPSEVTMGKTCEINRIASPVFGGKKLKYYQEAEWMREAEGPVASEDNNSEQRKWENDNAPHRAP